MKISKKVKNIMKISALLAILMVAGTGGINQTVMAAEKSNLSSPTGGASSMQSADFGPYMKRMQDKIKANWRPPVKDRDAQIVVKYRILRDGTLDSYGILSSSGFQDLDSAAIDALRSAAPFEPIPASFDKESILVQFTFDYQKPKTGADNTANNLPPNRNNNIQTRQESTRQVAEFQPLVPLNNTQTTSSAIPAGTPATPIRIKANPGEPIQIQKLPPKQKIFPPVRAVNSYEQTSATLSGSQGTVQKYVSVPENVKPPEQITQVYNPAPPPVVLEPIRPQRAIVPLPPKNTDPRTVAVPPPIRQTPSVDITTYAQGDLLDLDKNPKDQAVQYPAPGTIIQAANNGGGPTPVTASQINQVVAPHYPEVEYVKFEEVQDNVPVNTTLATGINKVEMPAHYRRKLTRPVTEEQYQDIPEYTAVPAPTPPGREPGVYVTPVKVTDFSEYMRKVQRKITRKWKPPLSDYSTKVVVNYVIHKNGDLGNYYVAESSGNSRMDVSAMEALKKAAPFPPLPVGFGEESVDVKFTFDYNVYKNKSEKKGIKELENKEDL